MKKMEDLFLGGRSEWVVHYSFGTQDPYYYEKKSRVIRFQNWRKFFYTNGFIYAPFIFECFEPILPIYAKIMIKNRKNPSVQCSIYLWRSPLLGWFHVDQIYIYNPYKLSGMKEEEVSNIEKELLCNY